MKKRISRRNGLGRASVARRPIHSMAGGLLLIGVVAVIGCGDNSTVVPSEDEGLIEAPVEEEGGQGTQEFSSDRKAE